MSDSIPTDIILRKVQQGLRQVKYEQLGQLAVSGGFVTPGQLDRALEDQKSGPRRPLGEILLSRDLISPEQLGELLLRQKNRDISRVQRRSDGVTPPEVIEARGDPDLRFGRYVLVEEIGRGAMGTVWKGWDTELFRWVAVKVLKADSLKTRDRFLREGRVAASLRHPNLVTVYDAGENQGKPYLVMELIRGEPIELVTSLKDTLARLRKVALALQEAHDNGVVHRDLKPGNILVDSLGEPHVVDFGLAAILDSSVKLTQTGAVMGTPAYMAPEQVSGNPGQIGPRTDVYALGAILYEALAGVPPFRGAAENLFEHILRREPEAPEGPKDLVTICRKAMEKVPERRYESAREFSEDLRRYTAGEPIKARPPTIFYRVTRILRRRKVLASVAVASVLLAAGLAALLVPKWLEGRRLLREKEEERAAIERARPHVVHGQEILRRLDKLLMNPDATREQIRTAAAAARMEFERAVREHLRFDEAWMGIARAYRMEGNNEKALSLLDSAIGEGMRFAPAYLERMLLMLEKYLWLRLDTQGDPRPETAEAEDLRGRIEKDLADMKVGEADDVVVRYAEGILMLTRGKKEPALERFRDYARQRETDSAAWFHFGLAAWDCGREEEALAALEKSLRYQTGNVSALMLRSTIRRLKGEVREAVEDLDRLLRVRHEAIALSNRGSLRSQLGDHEGGLEDLDEALSIRPDFVSALVNRSTVHFRMGDKDRSLADLARALELSPGYYLARIGRYKVLCALGKKEEALEELNLMIREHPERADPYYLRGRHLMDVGRASEGIEDFGRAIEKDPRHKDAYVRRSVARRNLKDFEGALSDINEAIRLSPRDARAYYNRGALLHDMGRSKEAIEDYDEALCIRPDYALCLYSRGLVKASFGDAEGVLADFEKALESAPDDWAYREVVEERVAILKKALGKER